MTRQRSFAPALLAVLIVVAVAVIGWLAYSDAPVDDVAAGAPARASAPEPAVETPKLDVAPIERDAPAPRAPAAPRARAEVGDAERLELADALWVEGRVVMPQGTPLDEEVEVIADGKKFATLGDHRVRVEPDGRFRVAFSKETRSGSLRLDARYLYLDAPLKLKPGAPPDDIVLEPQLGACIRGAVVPPPGATDTKAAIGDARVVAFSWSTNAPVQQHYASVGDDLRYELRGLPTHRKHQINFEPRGWVQFTKDEAIVAPGAALELDLVCALGASLRGRVVDEAGEPLANATVEIASLAEGARWPQHKQVAAKKDGTFERLGVASGVVTLVAKRVGYVDTKLELGELKDGDVHDGLELVLAGGAFVSGVVKWDDGQPAAGAYVRVDEPREADEDPWNIAFEGADTKRADDEGRFRISGLGAGPFTVLAQLAEGAKPEFDADGKPIKKSRLKGPKWRAEAKNVAVGAEVELILRPGLAIHGRVVDELGAPIAKAAIRAEAKRDSRGMGGRAEASVTKVDSEDGRFTLGGLAQGAWQIEVSAKGFTPSGEIDLQVPLASPLPDIVLTHTATIRGVVVDATGAPVSKAGISIDIVQEQKTVFRFGGDAEASSNTKGEFEIEDAPAGTVQLTVEHAAYARSTPLELSVAPSQTIEGVRLVLTSGGRIAGRLHESALAAAKGWEVSAYGKGGGAFHRMELGEDGRFELERMTPGAYQVSANAPQPVNSASGGALVLEKLSARRITADVDVVDGQTTEVVLGAPSGAAVLVTGRVTRGGAPVPGARISVWGKSSPGQVESGADGVYRVTLDGAGDYSFNVSGPSGGAALTQWRSIPQEPSYTLDFEFANGRISGRVVDQNGEPVARASVRAALTDSKLKSAKDLVGAVQGDVVTGDDGAFVFDGLAQLEFTLTVSDDGIRYRNKPRFGVAYVPGLSLTAGALDGVEVRVAPPAALSVVVRSSSGAPAVGARIQAIPTGEFEIARFYASDLTDGVGRALLEYLSTGEYRILATLGEEIGELRGGVRVRNGEASTVEVDMRLGAYLQVSARNAEGQLLKPTLSVLDENGREWARGATRWKAGEDSDAFPSLGPLPPGAYEVRASRTPGGSATKRVTLRSGDHESVVLQLEAD